MEDCSVRPDTNTLHVAILACEAGGKADLADELLGRIESVGARPPTSLYNSALGACASAAAAARAAAL